MQISTYILRLVVLVLPFSFTGMANAQSNPFDETCTLLTQITSDPKTNCSNPYDSILSYKYSFGSDVLRARATLNSLVEKFGEPESVRGNNHVWRVNNPGKNAKQKRTVTIILTHDPIGESKIMMDRVRPGTVAVKKKREVEKREIKRINKTETRPRNRKVRENDAF